MRPARCLEACREGSGGMQVSACIEDLVVIKKIFDHLNEKIAPKPLGLLPPPRAPAGLFG